MPIKRHQMDKDFTILPNSLLRDTRLGLRDLGLLCLMLSLPADWDFSLEGLAAIIPKIGISSLKASVRELEKAGYLKRDVLRVTGGAIGKHLWSISDQPEYLSLQAGLQPVENPPVKNQPVVNLLVDNPPVDKQPVVNRRQTKNRYNKEKNNKYHSSPSAPDEGERRRGWNTGVTYYIGEEEWDT